MKYPATIVDDDLGWGRIHLGHGLDREFLRRELFEANVEDPPHDDSDIVVEEVFYKYLPRIKRCSDYLIGGCDLEGEWHDHWYSGSSRPSS